MNRTKPGKRYSIGELVSAAYKEARRITRNRQVAALMASTILEIWLTRSDRPDLVRRLQLSAV